VLLVDHRRQPLVSWRRGNRTRLHAAESNGAAAVCAAEQWIDPGTTIPSHRHPNAEEIVMVIEGRARYWADGERGELDVGDTIVLPADSRHGFASIGDSPLHVHAVLSSAAPETLYDEWPEDVVEIGGTEGIELDATRVLRART
jgi:quercetin dioxygenase-like cupin family protein